jgi:hypothetical protein
MTGYQDLNFPAFDEARDFLVAEGYDVVSPADMDREQDIVPGETEMTTEMYADAMRRDIAAITTCDAIIFLPDWALSHGAQIEHYVAKAIGLEMLYLKRTFEISEKELTHG